LQQIAEVRLRNLPASGRSPAAVALLDGRLYVANWGSGNVSIIEKGRVTAVVDVGEGPNALLAEPSSGRVFVANRRSRTITALDDGHLALSWTVGGSPRCLALSGDRLYVGLDDRGSVLVYRLADESLVTEIELPDTFSVFALSTLGDRLYAKGFGHVYAIDPATNQVEQDVVLTDTYVSLAGDPVSGRVLVDRYDAATQESLLLALDPATGSVVGRAVIGGDPRGIAVDAAGRRAYVVSQFTRQVFVVDLDDMSVVARIPVGLDPESAVIDRQAERLYVANRGSQSVSVIDTAGGRLLSTVPLAVNPQGVAIDMERGLAFVAVPATASVIAVRGRSVVAEIPVGGHPASVAVDPTAQKGYVVDEAGRRGVVLDLRRDAVVGEVPLAPGARGASVDKVHGRVYMGDAVLDAATGKLISRLAVPNRLGPDVPPVRVLAGNDRLYVLAPNGIPGSNYGLMIYAFSGEPLKLEETRFGGLSTTDLAWDSTADVLYSTAFKMDAGWLYKEDGATGENLARIDLHRYPVALALDPDTHLLVVGLVSPAEGRDNILKAFDSRTMETLFQQSWEGGFGDLVFDTRRGWLYVTDPAGGMLSIWAEKP
jgi:YVTN family beta-propeller protein